jgi:hypothetical protein
MHKKCHRGAANPVCIARYVEYVLSDLQKKKKKTGRCWTLLGRASYFLDESIVLPVKFNCSHRGLLFMDTTIDMPRSIDPVKTPAARTPMQRAYCSTRPHTDDWSTVLRLRKRLSLPSSMHACITRTYRTRVHIEFAFISVCTQLIHV